MPDSAHRLSDDARAERAILDRAEAYRLVEEARQMRDERDDARAALARAEARTAGLVEALQTIRDHYGKVCEEYELCEHPACASSAGAWFEADAALAGADGQRAGGEGVTDA
jgi:hypothetical protein